MWQLRDKRAQRLLAQAHAHLESPHSQLMELASRRWWRGFSTGGPWMRRALQELQAQAPAPKREPGWTLLGIFKYGQCALAALAIVAVALALGQWWLLALTLPAFYLVEAQWVFLFVLVAQGHPDPLKQSARLTRRAGGAWRVMWTVLPLAWTMLTGWATPRPSAQAALKSWCAGCLAVVIWYLELHDTPSSSRTGASP